MVDWHNIDIRHGRVRLVSKPADREYIVSREPGDNVRVAVDVIPEVNGAHKNPAVTFVPEEGA